MKIRYQALLFALFCCLNCFSALAQRTWDGGGGDGDWFNVVNWDGDIAYPQAGENVIISNGASVLLSNNTAQLNTFTITNATLVFTNWSTKLLATNITIQNSGTFTPASGFATNEMSNRVYMICEDLMVANGGMIDADGLGWEADGLIINGTGAGGSSGSRGAAAAMGAEAARSVTQRCPTVRQTLRPIPAARVAMATHRSPAAATAAGP